jgi:hypothetical protein
MGGHMRFLVVFAILLIGCAKTHNDQVCPVAQSISAPTGKPTILIIGDSISIGYAPYVESGLPNYDVVHNPCNAMTTFWTITQIDYWLAGRPTFEAITFNNGLWDISSWVQTTDAEYIDNLHTIAKKVKAKTSKPLFILSTQILPGTPYRWDGDVVHKNALAVTVMNNEGIPVLDLYSVSATIPFDHVSPIDPHYTQAGYSILGQAVLGALSTTYGIN